MVSTGSTCWCCCSVFRVLNRVPTDGESRSGSVSNLMAGTASHCLHCHSGPIGLTDCEWFHGRCSWVCSHCLHCHSGPVGLTACEWFHGRCSWVCFHCFHSHSGPVGLTGSGWFHGMWNWADLHCFYSQLVFVDCIASGLSFITLLPLILTSSFFIFP